MARPFSPLWWHLWKSERCDHTSKEKHLYYSLLSQGKRDWLKRSLFSCNTTSRSRFFFSTYTALLTDGTEVTSQQLMGVPSHSWCHTNKRRPLIQVKVILFTDMPTAVHKGEYQALFRCISSRTMAIYCIYSLPGAKTDDCGVSRMLCAHLDALKVRWHMRKQSEAFFLRFAELYSLSLAGRSVAAAHFSNHLFAS